MSGSASRKLAALLVVGLSLCAAPAARGAAEAPVNRLALETSPYLLQHARNPVNWHPWGEEAFRKAREENKLIFLSIGYSTCYWCHVMERQVFADPLSAEQLNADFVSIMVDREARPDLDRIYMRVRVMMTGDGGWPLSVFLTPELEPLLAAGTILKPQFNELLSELRTGWSTQETRYRQHGARVAEALERSSHLPGEAESHDLPGRWLVTQAVELYARQFDSRHGGFGTGSKFPQAAILEVLMAAAERGEREPALSMAVETLAAMARGGIHDQLGGGFHRYTVDRAWQVPHFEKMLYDNAQLLHAYAKAYSLTGNEAFRRAAEGIVAYLRREMTGRSGLFHSAQDSESEGEEGAYYLWARRELQDLLREEELAVVSSLYDLVPLSGGEGAYVLTQRKAPRLAAEELGLTDAQLERRSEAARRKLLEVRAGRMPLFRDETVIASWNGLMIEALAYAGGALDRPDYLGLAERAARALLHGLADGQGGLFRVARGGQAKIPAQLADYAAVILGLTELHRATGNALWRGEAARLADRMVARLYDEENGGFLEASPGTGPATRPLKDSNDGAMPAGNSLAARALLGLAAEGLPRFALHARYVFSAFAPTLEAQPQALPYMLWALEEFYGDGSAVSAEPGPPRATAEVVRIAARFADADSGSAARPLLLVGLDIDEGWHVNANPASFDFLVPTRVSARVGEQGRPLDPVYPSGKALDTPLGVLEVYEDAMNFEFVLPAAVPDGRRGEPIMIRAELQACNQTGTCLPPETLVLALHF